MLAFNLPPPPGTVIDVCGEPIHTIDIGPRDAPNLVLVHGFLSSTIAWKPVIDALAADHRVIAPDLVGHGYSSTHDQLSMTLTEHTKILVNLLTKMEVGRYTLVGQSMGGAVSLALAAQRPDAVERLVLVDPICYPFDMPLSARIANLPFVGSVIFNHLYSRRVFSHYSRCKVYHNPNRLDEHELDVLYAHFNRPAARRAAYRGMVALQKIDWLAAEIAQIRCPTLILWGAQDHILPVQLAAKLAENIPNSILKIVEDCGHQMMTERPQAFLQHVLPFLSAPPA